jgi:hypothetical protein
MRGHALNVADGRLDGLLVLVVALLRADTD